jgi:hypothetical protein
MLIIGHNSDNYTVTRAIFRPIKIIYIEREEPLIKALYSKIFVGIFSNDIELYPLKTSTAQRAGRDLEIDD